MTTTLYGHQEAAAALEAAWRSGRCPHAWLLTGPRGVGKATLAWRFARYALSDGVTTPGLFGGDASGDGMPLWTDPESAVCQRVASGGHADCYGLERGWTDTTKHTSYPNSIPVALVRKTLDAIRLKPGEGAWRTVVIDGAEDMTDESANALLKALEEPQPGVLFVLVSHVPGRLLATLRSRCRRLTLQATPDLAVDAVLQRGFPALSAAERAMLKQLAAGCPGLAIRYASSDGAAILTTLTDAFATGPTMPERVALRLVDRVCNAETFPIFEQILTFWMGRLIRFLSTGAYPPAASPSETAALDACARAAGLRGWIAARDAVSTRLAAVAAPSTLDRTQATAAALLTLNSALNSA